MTRPFPRASALCVCLLASAAIAQPFGKSGGEFRVNTVTSLYTQQPAVGMDTAGSFLVTWTGGFEKKIQAQRYAAKGAPLGAEFSVKASATGVYNFSPAVVGQAAGRFMVVWETATPSGDGMNIRIFGQRVQDGATSGTAFRVDTGVTTARDRQPAVAQTANGDFAVVWGRELLLGATDDFDLYGRRFTSDAVALGDEFHVSTQTTNQGGVPPAVARRSDGAFLVTWTPHFGGGPAVGTVFGQPYDASGVPGTLLVSDPATAADEQIPRAAYDSAGNFVVVWAGDYHVAGGYLWGLRYDTAGSPRGGTFRIDTSTNALPQTPHVVSDSSGNFVVVWATDQAQVYARRFASSGAALSDPFRVNTTTTGLSWFNGVAMNGAGDFVVIWFRGPNNNNGNVYGQLYCATLAGDANASGTIDVADVFYLVNSLFAGGPAPVKGCDANGDGSVDVADVFFLINYLFAGGPSPACA